MNRKTSLALQTMNALFKHRESILQEYDGSLPLALFLKQYFRKFPVLGSRDRRLISSMLYSHFRAAKTLPKFENLETEIAAELILCEQDGNEHHRLLGEITATAENADLKARVKHLKDAGIKVDLKALLVKKQEFSDGISKDDWVSSLLSRTAVFIRVSPNSMHDVDRKLKKAGIEAVELENRILKFKQGRQLDQVLDSKSFRVQDYSSQKTMNFFPDIQPKLVWDVCSGAGGKALLISEKYPETDLIVSDVRKSILQSLATRFELYGREVPVQQIIDLTNLAEGFDPLAGQKAELIVCDVPCSGSGTWGRTPEDAYFFDENSMTEFNDKQLKIASTAAKYISKDGYFIYITCSIFKSENEDIVAKLIAESGLKLETQQVINGTKHQADTLFIAVLKADN